VVVDADPTITGIGTLAIGHGQTADITALIDTLFTAGIVGDGTVLSAVTATSGTVTLVGVDAQYTAPAGGTDAIGFTARANCETSLPSVSPKPPGSMKSRCISMMRSAVADHSRSIGAGSAAIVPPKELPEFAMTCASRARELSNGSKQGLCHCVQHAEIAWRVEIFPHFNFLDFRPRCPCFQGKAFVTRNCLFVRRHCWFGVIDRYPLRDADDLRLQLPFNASASFWNF